jgi:ectoine hydroxylase-related dioxygenase (phytanoyl-CoA dioxygenase family)
MIPLSTIIETVCSHTNFDSSKIKDKSRHFDTVQSRNISIYFHKQINRANSLMIASEYEFPDQTCVVRAVKYIKNRYKTEPYFKCLVDKIYYELVGGSKLKKAYLSGPMTGLFNLNKEAFADAETLVSKKGYVVVNPHNLPLPEKEEYTWEDYMKNDIKYLMDCDVVVALKGWEKSKGAFIEVELSDKLGIPIYELERFLKLNL